MDPEEHVKLPNELNSGSILEPWTHLIKFKALYDPLVVHLLKGSMQNPRECFPLLKFTLINHKNPFTTTSYGN